MFADISKKRNKPTPAGVSSQSNIPARKSAAEVAAEERRRAEERARDEILRAKVRAKEQETKRQQAERIAQELMEEEERDKAKKEKKKEKKKSKKKKQKETAEAKKAEEEEEEEETKTDGAMESLPSSPVAASLPSNSIFAVLAEGADEASTSSVAKKAAASTSKAASKTPQIQTKQSTSTSPTRPSSESVSLTSTPSPATLLAAGKSSQSIPVTIQAEHARAAAAAALSPRKAAKQAAAAAARGIHASVSPAASSLPPPTALRGAGGAGPSAPPGSNQMAYRPQPITDRTPALQVLQQLSAAVEQRNPTMLQPLINTVSVWLNSGTDQLKKAPTQVNQIRGKLRDARTLMRDLANAPRPTSAGSRAANQQQTAQSNTIAPPQRPASGQSSQIQPQPTRAYNPPSSYTPQQSAPSTYQTPGSRPAAYQPPTHSLPAMPAAHVVARQRQAAGQVGWNAPPMPQNFNGSASSSQSAALAVSHPVAPQASSEVVPVERAGGSESPIVEHPEMDIEEECMVCMESPKSASKFLITISLTQNFVITSKNRLFFDQKLLTKFHFSLNSQLF